MITNDHDVATALARTLAEPPAHLDALHRRLAAAARADGILDVACRTLDTRADGGLGGYLGGVEAKRSLLTLETR
jgi:hypothetical protein